MGAKKPAATEQPAAPQQPVAIAGLQVEQVGVYQLLPNPRNARTHGDAQLAQLGNSIREFGFIVPVLIDSEGTILAGHGRVMAAQRIGLETVPCVRVDHLTETQRRAFQLADNRIAANAGWDKGLLAIEVSDLKAAGIDVLELGFKKAELKDLAAPAEGADGGVPDTTPKGIHSHTFKVSTKQRAVLRAAIKAAIAQGAFGDTGNDNENGNALARICEGYLDHLAAVEAPAEG